MELEKTSSSLCRNFKKKNACEHFFAFLIKMSNEIKHPQVINVTKGRWKKSIFFINFI